MTQRLFTSISLKPVFLCGLILISPVTSDAAQEELIVHEWGTFTVLQNELGTAISRINHDDEPVPNFVHDLTRGITPASLPAALRAFDVMPSKGVAPYHPNVTMRLETPVTYFYPPSTASLPLTLDVDVEFHGGLLSEFYPDAKSNEPSAGFNPIGRGTRGRLSWKDIQVGGDWTGPQTDDPVWTAPRDVKAAALRLPNGEAEKFLFYRGVANLEAPLTVLRDAHGSSLSIVTRFDQFLPSQRALSIPFVCFVDIKNDGSVAFRNLPAMTLQAENQKPVAFSAIFAKDEYSHENLTSLQNLMHAALVQDGLYADEARAMLKTWEKSYFKSAGQRVFFLLPQVWTDAYLPIKISTPAKVSRVMVGRIELISPEHKHLVDDIVTGWPEEQEKAYQALGRFRDAIVLSEHTRTGNYWLSEFIRERGLRAATVK